MRQSIQVVIVQTAKVRPCRSVTAVTPRLEHLQGDSSNEYGENGVGVGGRGGGGEMRIRREVLIMEFLISVKGVVSHICQMQDLQQMQIWNQEIYLGTHKLSIPESLSSRILTLTFTWSAPLLAAG
jgi:hypothetical protein